MAVYVEYVFLDNLIIDALLISLARKSLHLQTKKKFVFLSSVFGGIVAVVFPLLRVSLAVGFLLKMPIGLIIVLLSGRFKSFGELIRCFYLFLFFTFCFGGGVIAVFWGIGVSVDPITYSNTCKVPMFLVLITAFSLYLLISKTIKTIYRRREISRFTYKCQAEIGGKQFEFTGYLDSGNNLVYRRTNSPIVVCSLKFSKKLKTAGVLDCSMQDVIAVTTVSGKCFMPIYKTQKFLIYNGKFPNILYNVMIGVADGKLSFLEEFDVLLGSNMV